MVTKSATLTCSKYSEGGGIMAKFEIGQLVATRGVHDLMRENPGFSHFAQSAFLKYRRCDWGDTCESDKAQNDNAVTNSDDRILAVYDHPDHPDWKIWIITECDRSATTLLFPSEY